MDKLNTTNSHSARRMNREERPVHPCTRDLVFSLATCSSLVVLGSWTLMAGGCGTTAKTNEQRLSQRRNDGTTTVATNNGSKSKSSDSTTESATISGQETLGEQLASTVDADRAALGRMQANRQQQGNSNWNSNSNTNSNTSTSEASFTPGEAPGTDTATLIASSAPHAKTYLPNGQVAMVGTDPNAMPPSTATQNNPQAIAMNNAGRANWNGSNNGNQNWNNNGSATASAFAPTNDNSALLASAQPKAKTYLPNGQVAMVGADPNALPVTSTNRNSTQTLASSAGTANSNANGNASGNWNGKPNTGNSTLASSASTKSGSSARANSSLELTQEIPTDPMELSKLLASTFARAGADTSNPVRTWFIFSSLAVSNPDLTLPEGFGHDLLPEERERVISAHAGFVALGRSFRDGATQIDPSTRQLLLTALGADPSLSIPKADLCTKVAGFGDYSPMARRRFLAGSTSRVIVYSELDGFKSQVKDGQWITRLATRVTIEPKQGGVANPLWTRSPEWTEVVDSSENRRNQFFLGEIVPIANNIPVGSYNMKLEVKDLATGSTTWTMLPIDVLDERAFVDQAD